MTRRQQPEPAPEPNGNQIKFAWIYDLCANPALSPPAKLVATLTVLKLAGRKGYFKATHKAMANLCGMTYRSVRRAVDELYREKYWDITDTSGGANVYTIIPPDERLELWETFKHFHEEDCRKWLKAEKEFVREWLDAEYEFVRQWLDAEKRFVQEWLDAEKQIQTEWLRAEADACNKFEAEVFDAVMDRCGNSEFAYRVAHIAWEGHQAGQLTLAEALKKIAAKPQEHFQDPDPQPDEAPEMDRPLSTNGQTPGHGWTDPCPPVDRPLSNSDSLTSVNDHSHKSFKSVKTLKELKGEHAARPPASGRSACPPKTCNLCYGTGKFLDRHGYVINLLNDEDDEEYEVDCQHSMAGNLAEIRRIESESEGFWQIAKTGHYEIDSQFDHLKSTLDDDLDY